MISKVTVVGAGMMGSGIAQSLAMGNKSVVLYSNAQESVQSGMKSIERSLKKFIKTGTLSESGAMEVLENISVMDSLKEALSETELVIEAAAENLQIKKGLFKKIDELSMETAILATYTSELSITEIADSTSRPDKVVGMHWFNPAPAMRLIEIIKGVETSEETVEEIQQLSEEIGKETVLVKDAQGVVTTRALSAHILECMRIYEEGLAYAEDIDKAVRLGLNYPMGPLELADYVGLDTMLFATEGMAAAYGERFRPPQILRRLVEAGHFGRKSGQGFYQY